MTRLPYFTTIVARLSKNSRKNFYGMLESLLSRFSLGTLRFFYLSLVTRNAIRVVSCVLTLGLTESDFRTDERNGNKREEEYIEIHSNPLCRVPWCCRYLCGIIIVQLFAASERLALPSSPFLTYPSPHSSCRLNFFFFRCTRCTLTNAISSRRE